MAPARERPETRDGPAGRARLRVFHSARALPDPGEHAASASSPGATPAPAVTPGPRVACVVVADVLRATTTLVRAFANGARSARAFETIAAARGAQARALAAIGPGTRPASDGPPLLCGESNGRKPAGFDLGNSPLEFTPARIRGRDLHVATTNGAPAVARAPRGATVLLAAFTNLSAVVGRVAAAVLAARPAGAEAATPPEVWLVAAGQSGATSPEDDRCVAELAHRLAARRVIDGEWPAPSPPLAPGPELAAFLRATPHGQTLLAIDPACAHDIDVAAAVDSEECVPEGRDGVLHAGPARRGGDVRAPGATEA